MQLVVKEASNGTKNSFVPGVRVGSPVCTSSGRGWTLFFNAGVRQPSGTASSASPRGKVCHHPLQYFGENQLNSQLWK